MSQKYDPPTSPPPGYPQAPPQAHYDAGPAYPSQVASPAPHSIAPYQQAQPTGASGDFYQHQQYQQAPPGGYYGQPQGGYYGPPQGYGGYPQQGPMYYQQPAGGYYGQQRGRGAEGAMTGLCAGLCAGLCCLDLCLIF